MSYVLLDPIAFFRHKYVVHFESHDYGVFDLQHFLPRQDMYTFFNGRQLARARFL